MKEVDARKLACPAPVLAAKELMESEQPAAFSIIVDNDAARQNVSRFLESRSYSVSVKENGKDFIITGVLKDMPETSKIPQKETEGERKKIMVMISTDRIGFGDDELGRKLMISFVKTLKEMGHDLWRLVMVNNGVKLTIAESDVLDDLKTLDQDGIHILVCGTCLTHFNLLDKKQIGETTNMLDIVTSMQVADKVINI